MSKCLSPGFVIGSTGPKQVIIRELVLAQHFGLTGVLSNPTLELHRGNTTLATNDNWKIRSDGMSQQAQVEATGLAPTNNFEWAIVTTLNPGAYTAILKGKNNFTGIGLIEVYDLAPTTNASSLTSALEDWSAQATTR